MHRPANLAAQAEPTSHRFDLAKRHTGLHHAKGPRVHADEQRFLVAAAKPFEVAAMNVPGVLERVVDAGNRRRETEVTKRCDQRAGDSFEHHAPHASERRRQTGLRAPTPVESGAGSPDRDDSPTP